MAGYSRLKAVYNRLMDLEKIVGGSGEMFWRNARPGFQGEMQPDYTMSAAMEADLQDQLDEFDHNLRRFLVNEGIKFTPLTQPLEDPGPSVDIQIQMISAETGIPKRILTGSERGELASSEDRNNWFDLIQARREDFAEPVILRPLVERLMEFGALPVGGDSWTVEWEDLYAPSEKQKAEIGRVQTESLAKYVQGGVDAIIPPESYMEFMLGMDRDRIDEILAKLDEYQVEEAKQAEEDAKIAMEEQAKMAELMPQPVVVPGQPIAPKRPVPGQPVVLPKKKEVIQ